MYFVLRLPFSGKVSSDIVSLSLDLDKKNECNTVINDLAQRKLTITFFSTKDKMCTYDKCLEATAKWKDLHYF